MIHPRYSRRHRRKIKPNTRQRIRVMHAYVAKGHAAQAFQVYSLFSSLNRRLVRG